MPFHNSTPASYPVPGDDAIVISSDDDSEEDTGETNDFDHDDSRASGGEADDGGTKGADDEDAGDSKDSTGGHNASNDSANRAGTTDYIAEDFGDTHEDTSATRTAGNYGRDGNPTHAAVAATGEHIKWIVQEMAVIQATLARIEAKLHQKTGPAEATQTSIATRSQSKRKQTNPASEFQKRQRKDREA
ncbi:hypothetical protein Ct61P_01804 [Colletotrichum tofieldiae]|nr:hypothetical protein Ct61P_01804 [Colletotrichum tofieldiae]